MRCDQVGCDATGRAPVGLRRLLTTGEGNNDEALAAGDWLFIATGAQGQHYCPVHAPARLRALRASTILGSRDNDAQETGT